jgi:hypothetical protein
MLINQLIGKVNRLLYRKYFYSAFVSILCCFQTVIAPNAFAQAWPNKPIKIIIPFPPGDSIDLTTRMISPKLTEILGQPIIVENVIGGSGSATLTTDFYSALFFMFLNGAGVAGPDFKASSKK